MSLARAWRALTCHPAPRYEISRSTLLLVGLRRDGATSSISRIAIVLIVLLSISRGLPLWARDKNSIESFGMGLSVTVTVPEAELLQAVQDVVADGIIQG